MHLLYLFESSNEVCIGSHCYISHASHAWIAQTNSPRESLLWSTRFSNGTNSLSDRLFHFYSKLSCSSLFTEIWGILLNIRAQNLHDCIPWILVFKSKFFFVLRGHPGVQKHCRATWAPQRFLLKVLWYLRRPRGFITKGRNTPLRPLDVPLNSRYFFN